MNGWAVMVSLHDSMIVWGFLTSKSVFVKIIQIRTFSHHGSIGSFWDACSLIEVKFYGFLLFYLATVFFTRYDMSRFIGISIFAISFHLLKHLDISLPIIRSPTCNADLDVRSKAIFKLHSPIASSLAINRVPWHLAWHSNVLHLFKIILQMPISPRWHNLLIFKSFFVHN